MSKKTIVLSVVGGLFGTICFGGTWVYNEFKGNHYNKNGFNRYGYNKNGYNINGFDRNGYNEQGVDVDGFDKNGYDNEGFNRQGFDKFCFNREGFDKEGYDRQGYNADGNDRAGQNRKYYNESLREILKDISNHSKLSLKYRYKMLDYRFTIEKLLRMIIEHYKGKSILENRDNDFLNRYIELVYKEKLIDLTEDEEKSIKLAKNYFGDFLHPKKKEINNYKENKAIDTVRMLYYKVQDKLDIKIAA